MEQQETFRITTEDENGLTFATRHEWNKVHEEQLHDLNRYAIVSSTMGTSGIYHVLKNVDVMTFENHFKLVKYTVDEETGKIIMLMMDISTDEANEIINHDRCLSWI